MQKVDYTVIRYDTTWYAIKDYPKFGHLSSLVQHQGTLAAGTRRALRQAVSCDQNTKWMFPKIMAPQNGWFINKMENPIKIDDLGVFPLFLETPKCWVVEWYRPYSLYITCLKHLEARQSNTGLGSPARCSGQSLGSEIVSGDLGEIADTLVSPFDARGMISGCRCF